MSRQLRGKHGRKQLQENIDPHDARHLRLAEKRTLDHRFQNQKGPWNEDEIESPDTPSGLSGIPDSGGPIPR